MDGCYALLTAFDMMQRYGCAQAGKWRLVCRKESSRKCLLQCIFVVFAVKLMYICLVYRKASSSKTFAPKYLCSICCEIDVHLFGLQKGIK